MNTAPSTLSHSISAGDFLVETLVTDTIGWYVVKVTDRSIWIVPADFGVRVTHLNGSPYPVVLTSLVAPSDLTYPRRCGLRKDGTFRSWGDRRPLRPAPTAEFDGETLPYIKTDYSY
jgi:hypothetical protein